MDFFIQSIAVFFKLRTGSSYLIFLLVITGVFTTYIQFILYINFIQYKSDKVMGKLFKFLANLIVLSVNLSKNLRLVGNYAYSCRGRKSQRASLFAIK